MGAKVLEQISNDLQKELPGLRGFSASNIKRMRVFYEGWAGYFPLRSCLKTEIHVFHLAVGGDANRGNRRGRCLHRPLLQL